LTLPARAILFYHTIYKSQVITDGQVAKSSVRSCRSKCESSYCYGICLPFVYR